MRQTRTLQTQTNGFTLIELVTVVAIVGIIAAIAWPQFQRYEFKVSRTDAVRALSMAANDLEECAAGAGGDYRGCTLDSLDQIGDDTFSSPDGKYNITFVTALDANDNGNFTVTATKVATNDPDCTTLTLDQLGREGFTGAGTARECWGR